MSKSAIVLVLGAMVMGCQPRKSLVLPESELDFVYIINCEYISRPRYIEKYKHHPPDSLLLRYHWPHFDPACDSCETLRKKLNPQ